jgi:hypothetical protein
LKINPIIVKYMEDRIAEIEPPTQT